MRSRANSDGEAALRLVRMRVDGGEWEPAGGAVLIVGRCQRGMLGLAEQVVKAGKALLWHSRCADAIECLGERRIDMVLCQRSLPDGDWTRVQRALRQLRNPPPLVVLLPEKSLQLDENSAAWRLVPDGPPMTAA